MKQVVAAVLLAGCGRLAFDELGDGGASGGDGPRDTTPRIDAPPHGSLTHDEDGDGIVDGLDNCPHIAGSMADMDGDGVGDICDTAPGVPAQQITLFEGFEGTSAVLTVGSGWQVRPDAVRWPGPGFGAVEWNPHAVADVDIIAGFDVIGLTAAADHQLIISLDQPGSGGRRTYGEIYDDNSTAYTAVTHYDGSSYNVFDQQTFPTIPTGRLDLVFKVRVSPREATVRAHWAPSTDHTSTSTAITYGPAPNLGIALHDITVDLRYLLVIETN